MCLYVSDELTKKAKKQKTGFKICYKKVKLISGKIQSQYFPHNWKPGWNKSANPPKIDAGEVRAGIHVYSRRPKNEGIYRSSLGYLYTLKIMKVICYNKDLCACEHGSLRERVYSKVFLTRKEYDRLKKLAM